VATLGIALAFTFGCSSGGDGSGEQSYNYCVTAGNTCHTGPFTASTCTGQLSNSCPNNNGNVSSSSIIGGGSSSSKNNSSSSSNSSGSGGDILGSCTVNDIELFGNLCVENVSQAECSSEGGTFNSGSCNLTSYPYCLGVTGNSIMFCYLIGSDVPTKADCPNPGLFLSSATCGGSIGSCTITSTTNIKWCQEIPQNLCNVYQRMYKLTNVSDANVNFNSSGECDISQYPCCFSEVSNIRYLDDSGFSKSDCFSEGGMLGNTATCELYSQYQ